jgi:hypothetical protein
MEECSLCTSLNHLYPMDCPGHHYYCLSCIKGMCLTSSTMTRVQCPECRYVPQRKHLNALCEEPSKVKKIAKNDLVANVSKKTHIWIYEGRNNGWWYYDYEMQDILDETYMDEMYLNWVVCGQKICIDFTNMIQINNDNKAVRRIRRLTPNELKLEGIIVKGVGGMTTGDRE